MGQRVTEYITNRIQFVFESKIFLVWVQMCLANSWSIVLLFDALSHIMCLILVLSISIVYTMKGYTLWAIPTHETILNNAWPSHVPLWALFNHMNPRSAVWSCHFSPSSSIHDPVTAKYPSEVEACQASHVKAHFFFHRIALKGGEIVKSSMDAVREHHLTFNLLSSAVNCCLNVLMMASQVWHQSEILMPFVARAAMLIRFWNDGCCSDWMGCDIGVTVISNVPEWKIQVFITNLVGWYQPLNHSSTEKLIAIWNCPLFLGFLYRVRVDALLFIGCGLFAALLCILW